MKQLQNNFTTPEQSKRLLEFGVPADSADCYRTNTYERRIRQYAPETSSDFFTNHPHQIPCWSVGRLIEIYVIARGVDTSYIQIERGEDMVKYLIRLYEEKVKDLNFSKLED